MYSAEIPSDGKGVADKGFENSDRNSANFNRVRCPHVLRCAVTNVIRFLGRRIFLFHMKNFLKNFILNLF